MRKLSEEQKETMERLGFGNQHLVGAGFLLVALLILVINMICRVEDSHKYDSYEYTTGIVVKATSSKIPRTWGRGSEYDYIYSIEVEYSPEGYDKSFWISDSGEAYQFFKKGKELRINYSHVKKSRAA